LRQIHFGANRERRRHQVPLRRRGKKNPNMPAASPVGEAGAFVDGQS